MRTFLLISGTLALLVGIFIGYSMTQTGSAPLPPGYGAGEPVALPDVREAIIGRGEQAWVKVFNENWEVASQFRAAEYDPRRDGRVQVAQPESIFFLSGGELIRVRGREGVVVMSRLPEPQSGGSMAPSEPPSRGELIDVEIELFESPEALEADSPDNDTAILRVLLNNAAFDNETSRIYTESAVIDGRHVPADEIPVTVRGRDYEFDGRGLTIRWNDRDRRLELLRIEHGERLVIRNPHRLTRDVFGPSHHPEGDARSASLPWMLASTSAAAVADAVAAPTTRSSRPPYRANFDRNVRVFQGDQQLVEADQMFIDFVFDSSQQKRISPPEAGDLPGDDGPAAALSSASAIVAADSLPSTQPAEPDAKPAEQPVQPLIVHWDGPLIVTPSPETAPRPAKGAGIIHLVGQPLRVQRDHGDVTAATMVYDTGAQWLTLDGSKDLPVILRDGKDIHIQTQGLTYIGSQQRAELRGRSSATFAIRSDVDAPPQSLQTHWTDKCVLFLSKGGLERLAVERAQLTGSVQIEHPAVRLASQSLDLAFNPASADQPADTQPDIQLRTLLARGDVDCVLLSEDQSEQRIQADRLEIATAVDEHGRTYPREIKADGRDVRATDGTQTLAAHHLIATLRPTDTAEPQATSQQIVLDRLIAIDAAEYTHADGQRAVADRIEVVITGDQPTITLLGDATMGDDTTTVRGPHVQVLTAEQIIRIIGPGMLEASVQTDPGTDPRPLSVEWNKNAVVDGKANRVDVTGDIVVTTSAPDGAAHGITSRALAMRLADVESERSVLPDDRQRQDRSELLERKRVESVVFDEDVVLTSMRSDEAGRVLRRFVLKASRLEYEPQRRRMVVPAAGGLAFEDHPQNPDQADDTGNQLFGTTGMRWSKQLVYDEREQHITLDGDVHILHQPDPNQKQPSFQLWARTVTAELQAAEQEQPAGKEGLARPDLRRLIAEHNVRFESRGIELEAVRIEHDPQTGMVIAAGTQDAPVEIHRGVTRGAFREARFNLRTEQLQVIDFRGNVRQ